jgi:hypothetical protein
MRRKISLIGMVNERRLIEFASRDSDRRSLSLNFKIVYIYEKYWPSYFEANRANCSPGGASVLRDACR